MSSGAAAGPLELAFSAVADALAALDFARAEAAVALALAACRDTVRLDADTHARVLKLHRTCEVLAEGLQRSLAEQAERVAASSRAHDAYRRASSGK